MNSGGYGSICKRSNHRPGSLLTAPLSSFYASAATTVGGGAVGATTAKLRSPQGTTAKLPLGCARTTTAELRTTTTGGAGFATVNKSKGINNVIEGFEDVDSGKRFVPDPSTRSLSYRFDAINDNTPNAYAEFTSSTEGLYTPRFTRGQTKEGATKGCTSCFSPKNTASKILSKVTKSGGSCSSGSCGTSQGGLDPILDPKFNLREVAKHMILLEDHLFQPGRRCDDCINKHRLALEAFLEEAVTLDKTGEYQEIINSTLTRFRQIMREWVEKVRRNPVGNVDEVYFNTAQQLRALRKPLCMSYCDFC
jgi:hypothetical protein